MCPLLLNASASSQFSEKGLQTILSKLPTDKVVFVDLRMESHGFVNGSAISWYGEKNWANLGKTLDEIILDEQYHLAQIAGMRSLSIWVDDAKIFILAEKVQTEKELLAAYGYDYVRIPVADHIRPTDEQVDRFVEQLKDLPDDYWVHFHCSAGVGRATIGMIMYDIMCNADTMTLDEILERQAELGGKDFRIDREDGWKTEAHADRILLLNEFYDYWKETHGSIAWSKWIQSSF